MFVRELKNAQFVERMLKVTFLDDLGGEDLIGGIFLRAFLHGRKATSEKDEISMGVTANTSRSPAEIFRHGVQ